MKKEKIEVPVNPGLWLFVGFLIAAFCFAALNLFFKLPWEKNKNDNDAMYGICDYCECLNVDFPDNLYVDLDGMPVPSKNLKRIPSSVNIKVCHNVSSTEYKCQDEILSFSLKGSCYYIEED